MRRGRSTRAMSKQERQWVAAVKHIGCILCRRLGYHREEGGPLAEAHHLLSGGIREGHMDTVGLCAWHHRGQPVFGGWNHKSHRRELGPALSEGSMAFSAKWGTDKAILEEQEKLVAAFYRAQNVAWLG